MQHDDLLGLVCKRSAGRQTSPGPSVFRERTFKWRDYMLEAYVVQATWHLLATCREVMDLNKAKDGWACVAVAKDLQRDSLLFSGRMNSVPRKLSNTCHRMANGTPRLPAQTYTPVSIPPGTTCRQTVQNICESPELREACFFDKPTDQNCLPSSF